MKHRNPAGEEEETQIDISPLIDCVFILLIFFIVTTRFIEEVGIDVEKPQPSPEQPQSDSESEQLVFTLDASDKLLLDGREIALGTVRGAVERNLAERDDAAVVVETEKGSTMGVLVTLMDAIKQGGGSVSLSPK